MVVAAALRIPPVFSSLPYIDYIDEGYVLHQATTILNRRTLDPGWYGYPSLAAYLTVVGTLAWEPAYRAIHGHALSRDLPRQEDQLGNYDVIAPPDLIVAGRLVAALFGLGTVLLTGMIGRSLIGRQAGLLAMLIAAMCPALVSRSANVIVDNMATFFAAATFWYSIKINAEPRRTARFAAFAGLSAGLTFASKYTDGLVFGAVLTVIARRTGSNRSRITSLATAIGFFLISSFVASPSAYLKFEAVWRELEQTARNYSTIQSSPGYLGQMVESSELGWFLALTGVVGVILMLYRKESRSFSVGWLIFAGTLFAVFAPHSFQPFRNLLPLVPGLCMGSSLLIVKARDVFASLQSRSVTHILAGLGVCALLLSLLVPSYDSIQERLTRRDTRTQALDWLREHTISTDHVLVLSELQFLNQEWNAISAQVQVASLPVAIEMLKQGNFDYIISSRFQAGLGVAPVTLAEEAQWQTLTKELPIRAKFGGIRPPLEPYFWHTNDELVIVRVERLQAAKR